MAYKIKIMVLGAVQTNCYILYDDNTRDALIFDPAYGADIIESFIETEGLNLKAVLLTHGHFDHIGAARKICDDYSVKLYGHEAEEEVVENPQYNMSSQMSLEPMSIHLDVKLKDNQIIDLAGFSFKVIHTSGHTVGGVCYYCEKEGILFSGDTLFACSVGRSDFPTASGSELIRSIRDKLMILPEDTLVYTGHGEQTTIKYEKSYNPFF